MIAVTSHVSTIVQARPLMVMQLLNRTHAVGLLLVCAILLTPWAVVAAPPLLLDFVVEPTILEQGSGEQFVSVSARVYDVDGDLKNVKVVIRHKGGIKTKTILMDDGAGEDAVAMDGRFTGRIKINVETVQQFYLSVKAKDQQKDKTELGAIVSVIDRATSPTLKALRVSPSNILVNSGSQIVTVEVDVFDPNDDLKSVKLERLKRPGRPERLERFGELLDDGTGGDTTAGDGVYTIQVPVDPASQGPIPLRIKAKDGDRNKGELEVDLLAGVISDPPLIRITAPVPGTAVTEGEQVVVGDILVDQLASVTCNNRLATVTESGFSCPPATFVVGRNQVTLVARDQKGNLTLLRPTYVFADGDTVIAVTGIVTKGPVNGVTVKVYSLGSGFPGAPCPAATNLVEDGVVEFAKCLLGRAVSEPTGRYAVAVPVGVSAPVLVEAVGGNNATYMDEATGTLKSFAAGQVLQATIGTLSPPVQTVAVTGLTHMATARVLEQVEGGTLTAVQVNAANTEVAQRYGLSDIIGILPSDISQQAFGESATYGLILAGFSQMARNIGTLDRGMLVGLDPMDLIQAIADDFSDGSLDGKDNGADAVVQNTTIGISTDIATVALGAAIAAIQASPANKTGVLLSNDILGIIADGGTPAADGGTSGGAPSSPSGSPMPSTLLVHPAPHDISWFGWSVAFVDDVNGDGIIDVAVGTPQQTIGTPAFTGAVHVFSGSDKKLLFTLSDPFPQESAVFGHAVRSIGDLTGDGVPDLAVGVRLRDVAGNDDQGQVLLYSGSTGTLFDVLDAPTPQANAWFGSAIVPAGDIDGDGIPDLVVSAAKQNVGVHGNAGEVYLFSGMTRSLLLRLNDPDPQDDASFGTAIATIMDVDQDGMRDIIVGAPFPVPDKNENGRVYVLSSRDGTVLSIMNGPSGTSSGGLGAAVAAIGDLNGDAISDIVVGAPIADGPIQNQGRAFVFSGKDGSLIRTLEDPSPLAFGLLGNAIAPVADINGDGVPDIAIGAPAPLSVGTGTINSGQVIVFDGADGQPLIVLDNPSPGAGATFGFSLDAVAGTIPRLLVGAPFHNAAGGTAQGEAFLIPLP